jgi:hypothetical protein
MPLHLVTAHELAALDDALVRRAVQLLLDTAAALSVDQVKVRRLGRRGGVEADGNRDQTEAQRRSAE